MRIGLRLPVLILCTYPAFAQDDQMSADMKRRISESTWDLILADECNKRFDDPEIFDLAAEVFRKTARELNIPDADGIALRTKTSLRDRPQEKTNGFSLSSASKCDLLKSRARAVIGR